MEDAEKLARNFIMPIEKTFTVTDDVKHITHVCRIVNHPISKLPYSIQMSYLFGLGATLFAISYGHSYMRLLYREWCISISGSSLDSAFKNNLKAEKQALSLKRIGLKFFRMKYEYFFDCFYLTQVFDERLLPKLYTYLKEQIAGMFTKRALNDVNAFFTSREDCVSIPQELVEHYKVNTSFTQQPLKKVLVVANVSAGKSTLINALVGYRLNKAKTTACTSRLGYLYNKPVANGITVFMGNECFDYYENIEATNSDKFLAAGLHFNSLLVKYRISLIDTPGVNNSVDAKHKEITEKAIKERNYDALIYVSNCQYFGTKDEERLLQMIINYSKKPVIYVLNQLDRFKSKEDSVAKMLQDYRSDLVKMGVKVPTVIPVSAYGALLMKLEDKELDEDEQDELAAFQRRFSKEFYDLPSYVTNKQSLTLLEKTGIKLLEETIIKTIVS